MAGKIQCSQTTADSLTRSGKGHWLEDRKDLVSAKGKGILKTFWLTPYVDRAYSANGEYSDDEGDVLSIDFASQLANQLLKREREVEWVSELIKDSAREIVASRETRKGKGAKFAEPPPNHRSRSRVPLDEVVDVIKMPTFDSKSANAKDEVYTIKIPDNVSRLIREYVSIISAAYRKNKFHNFEHACHVTMCVSVRIPARSCFCFPPSLSTISLSYFLLVEIFEAHRFARFDRRRARQDEGFQEACLTSSHLHSRYQFRSYYHVCYSFFCHHSRCGSSRSIQ